MMDRTWNIKKLFKRKPVKPKISSLEIAGMIQSILVNLKTGSTLNKALQDLIDLSGEVTAIAATNKMAMELQDKNFWRFTRLLNQYHKNGSESTFVALQKYHDELWLEHSSYIKKKAEESTIKLTLLLMLSLISIVAVIMTPVMLLFGF